MDSTSGEILIDGKPSTDYDLRELRRSMAVLLQCEEIYPVSVRDNLLMGLAKPMGSDPKLTEKMDVACEMGGAYDLVQRLGYDRIPRPFWHYSTSMEGCGVGPASEAVMEEVRRHTSYMDSDPVSGGEEQRLIAYVSLSHCTLILTGHLIMNQIPDIHATQQQRHQASGG